VVLHRLAEQLLTAGRNGLKVGLLDLARRYSPYRIIRKDVRHELKSAVKEGPAAMPHVTLHTDVRQIICGDGLF
jgi:hypothetical protein